MPLITVFDSLTQYVWRVGWIDQLILFDRPIHQLRWLCSGIDGVCSTSYNSLSAYRKFASCVPLNAGFTFYKVSSGRGAIDLLSQWKPQDLEWSVCSLYHHTCLWLKGRFTQSTKNVFSHLPTVVSIYADSFSLICPGFEISVPEVSAYMILNAVECLSFWRMTC